MKSNPHLRILLGLALPVFAAAVLLGGCGGDDRDNPESKFTGFLLDSPTLAAEGFPPIEDGVPVFCYHYFRSGLNGSYLMKVLGSVLFGMPRSGPARILDHAGRGIRKAPALFPGHRHGRHDP